MSAWWVGACTDDRPSPKATEPVTVQTRVEIARRVLLFTAAGQSRQLAATVRDAEGNLVDAPVTWTSSDETVVSVSPDGMVLALVDVGSAQVVADAEGVVSPSTLVILAKPADGAVLVANDQVVGPLTPVDDAAEYAPGFRYRATLRGLPANPSVNGVLLAAEDAPLSGRVVSVEPAGQDLLVTLEVVALEELFEEIDLEEEIAPHNGNLTFSPDLLASFAVAEQADGLLELTALPRADKGDGPEFKGFLDCKVEGSAGPIEGGAAPLNVDVTALSLKLDFKSDVVVKWGTFLPYAQKMKVSGEVAVGASLKAALSTGLSGKLSCDRDLPSYTIPMGALTPILAGRLHPGVGFVLSGEVTLAEVGLQLAPKLGVKGTLGFECDGTDCVSLNDVEACPGKLCEKGAWDFKWLYPDPKNWASQVRVKLEAKAFGYLEMGLGPPWLAKSLDFLRLELGLKQSADWSLPRTQAMDDEYASTYQLDGYLSLGPAKTIEKVKKWLKGKLAFPSVATTVSLFKSPLGSIQMETTGLAVGKAVPATITLLDNPWYLLKYNVTAVDIYRLETAQDGTFQELVLETSIPAFTDQTTFVWDYVPTAEDLEKGATFVPFWQTWWAPGVDLEIDQSAKLVVAGKRGPDDQCLPPWVADPTGVSDVSGLIGDAVAPTIGASVSGQVQASCQGDNGSLTSTFPAFEMPPTPPCAPLETGEQCAGQVTPWTDPYAKGKLEWSIKRDTQSTWTVKVSAAATPQLPPVPSCTGDGRTSYAGATVGMGWSASLPIAVVYPTRFHYEVAGVLHASGDAQVTFSSGMAGISTDACASVFSTLLGRQDEITGDELVKGEKYHPADGLQHQDVTLGCSASVDVYPNGPPGLYGQQLMAMPSLTMGGGLGAPVTTSEGYQGGYETSDPGDLYPAWTLVDGAATAEATVRIWAEPLACPSTPCALDGNGQQTCAFLNAYVAGDASASYSCWGMDSACAGLGPGANAGAADKYEGHAFGAMGLGQDLGPVMWCPPLAVGESCTYQPQTAPVTYTEGDVKAVLSRPAEGTFRAVLDAVALPTLPPEVDTGARQVCSESPGNQQQRDIRSAYRTSALSLVWPVSLPAGAKVHYKASVTLSATTTAIEASTAGASATLAALELDQTTLAPCQNALLSASGKSHAATCEGDLVWGGGPLDVTASLKADAGANGLCTKWSCSPPPEYLLGACDPAAVDTASAHLEIELTVVP